MKKKNIIAGGIVSLIFLLTACLFMPSESHAGDVDFHIGFSFGIPSPYIVPPPQIVVPAPPTVFLIPGTYVYYVPYVTVPLFFYSGYWYLYDDDCWFRAGSHSGPWVSLPTHNVPAVFGSISNHYYKTSPGKINTPNRHQNKSWKREGKRNYISVNNR
jgi:hypothetical protein